MAQAYIFEMFEKIKFWQQGGQRAPHKALLILYALARLQQGAGRMISYLEIDNALRSLLIEFGPSRKSYHPEYPFWRLQNDNVWEVPAADTLSTRKGNT